jgi:SAM-dependent MidA family methyltransferase
MSRLPSPSPDALAHGRALAEYIRQAIEQAGGALSFAEYMRLALYAPGLGYYSAGARKFGEHGDFVTAPELSPLFSYCLARQAAQVLEELGGGEILEFGAGSGGMAADILAELERLDCLPTRYFILELSADLRARQQDLLQARLPHLRDRVTWLDELPVTRLRGVLLANEVLDAMPVARFRVAENGEIEEFYVRQDGDGFAWITRQAQEPLRGQVAMLGLPAGYISELNPTLSAWCAALAESLEAGLILLIDYGFPRREYYHPQRHQGTLMCHYRHHAHTDPFFYPGLQDITAHVDFTAVADAALAAGLELAGYTTQADFLLASGLEEMLAASDPTDYAAHLALMQRIKPLIMPSEMGELFKVMGLSRELSTPLRGFSRDRRKRL